MSCVLARCVNIFIISVFERLKRSEKPQAKEGHPYIDLFSTFCAIQLSITFSMKERRLNFRYIPVLNRFSCESVDSVNA